MAVGVVGVGVAIKGGEVAVEVGVGVGITEGGVAIAAVAGVVGGVEIKVVVGSPIVVIYFTQ